MRGSEVEEGKKRWLKNTARWGEVNGSRREMRRGGRMIEEMM